MSFFRGIFLGALLGLFISFLGSEVTKPVASPTEIVFDQEVLSAFPSDVIRVENVTHSQVRFGRTRTPLDDATILDKIYEGSALFPLRKYLTLKRWAYLSLDSPDLFMGLAVVQFNYISQVFAYGVKKNGLSPDQALGRLDYTMILPFGVGVSFAESSTQGCTTWKMPMMDQREVSICAVSGADGKHEGYRMKLDLPMVDLTSIEGNIVRVQADVTAQHSEALAIVFPLSSTHVQPAYIHKVAGMPSSGVVTLGHESFDLSKAQRPVLSSLDWTYSYARRETNWYWLSCTGTAVVHARPQGGAVKEGKSDSKTVNFGINLSSLVYDLDDQGSQENAIWIDGHMIPLGGVDFALPQANQDPFNTPWGVSHMTSASTHYKDFAMQLEFLPLGGREDHTNAGVIVSDFIQPYGLFKGTVSFVDTRTGVVYDMELSQENEVFGVMERHRAVW